MARCYWNVSSRSVLKTFENAAPCNCHQDKPCQPTIYNVLTKTTNTCIVNRGSLIQSIRVGCAECGRELEIDVESYGVYENDFNPY